MSVKGEVTEVFGRISSLIAEVDWVANWMRSSSSLKSGSQEEESSLGSNIGAISASGSSNIEPITEEWISKGEIVRPGLERRA
ncbi:hypothetical protein OGATHE_001520 [Ogataea polymorpha]|uniref:Uncharacterized protein n=1 Tax=Ogataea polymorpha TaxID=460523 RepID=A0A9P8TDJ3_9ASCO|nr:hypothetical protein OGATHE_001520 [Ogataea polymorpha]